MAAVCMVLMAACARSEASELQVQARAEEITELLLSAAEGVPRYQDDIIDADDRKTDIDFRGPWRYWEVYGDMVLAEDSPTSALQVRDEMARLLLADGWTEDDRNDAISGGDTFRKQDLGGSWAIELGAWDTPPPTPQQLYFWVISPTVDH